MYTQIPPDVPARDRQMIPMRTLESIADAVAFEVWGERVGRGVPVPLSDRRGTFAYLFGYVRGETRFPSIESVFDHLRELRRQADADLAADRVGTYRADLRDFGNRFGSVCVSATQDDPPVMWISHFLPTYFITAEDADLEARRRIGADVSITRYYHFSPEEQYLEFTDGARIVLVDAGDPRREVPQDALTARTPTSPRPVELRSAVSDSWARALALPRAGNGEGSSVVIPEAIVQPAGLAISEIGQTHTVKKIPYWELIPVVDHTPHNWCVPSSWAMVLGFYDNYVKGKGTLLGYGRWIDHWYELTPGGFNLPNLVDDVLPPSDAQAINGYTWAETKTMASATNEWGWASLKAEVDAGRPCFFTIEGHTTAAFGYRVTNTGERFAIVWDPPNPSTPTHVNEYSLSVCVAISAVTLAGGTDQEGLIIVAPDGGETFNAAVPNEIVWFVWGSGITKARVSFSQDGGNSWQVISDQVPARGAWNGFAWVPGVPGNRVRAKVEGLDAAGNLIASDGSFHNLTVKPTKTGGDWAQIWGPAGSVIAGDVPGSQPVVYATELGSGDIHRWDSQAGAWTKVGGPGKAFVLDDEGHLYGLAPDGSAVYRYEGTPMAWTQIGGPASALYAGGGSLFAVNPQTGDIHLYANAPMQWNRIGGPGETYAVDGKGRLYGISQAGAGVYRWDGTPMQWTKIGEQASGLWAGGSGLYATRGPGNDVHRYSLAGSLWTKVGGPGKAFAVDDGGRLYGLSPQGASVHRNDGSWSNPATWSQIGSAAEAIFAGGSGRLFATAPGTCDLWAFT